jgi:hypothetical protein
MKDLYDSTICENLYLKLNREVARKCALFLPSIRHSEVSSIYEVKCQPHEAGYDAYMCGCIFLKLAHAMATFDSKNCYNIRPNNMNDYFLIMKPYENKINLIQAAHDFINLKGKEPRSIPIDVIYVQSRNEEKPLKMIELLNALSSFDNCEIRMKSKSEAFIHVNNQNNIKRIISEFEQSQIYNVSIYNYWTHSKSIKYTKITSLILVGGLLTASILWFIKKEN